MSYRAAAALQAAIYARLTAAPALAGVPVLDAVAPGSAPGCFVLIGPETVLDQSDQSGPGAEHRLALAVISDGAGFLEAKTVAGALCAALEGADLALASGVCVSVQFLRAEARRQGGAGPRRIDLSFRARIAF